MGVGEFQDHSREVTLLPITGVNTKSSELLATTDILPYVVCRIMGTRSPNVTLNRGQTCT